MEVCITEPNSNGRFDINKWQRCLWRHYFHLEVKTVVVLAEDAMRHDGSSIASLSNDHDGFSSLNLLELVVWELDELALAEFMKVNNIRPEFVRVAKLVVLERNGGVFMLLQWVWRLFLPVLAVELRNNLLLLNRLLFTHFYWAPTTMVSHRHIFRLFHLNLIATHFA